MLLLASAFSVIYLKDLSRRLFINYQHLQHVQQRDEVEWSKLLLEEGAWSTQARIQNIANTQLNMVVPAAKQIVMIQAAASR
ncbi:MAG: cell division protein FtsL [Gammaproteobacteria bacterium RIFCSPHIGHO2_12_FULL_38_11]|nr:MAG: cell division protein FtsL [Gammaproteobacteria bacterium RIFCSPHIGHO2_12_FULL_38_11]